jgi:glycine hydroxymethyltransferase
VTSGIRIGTPYVTSRGMMAEQMKVIGGLMAEVLHDPENETLLKKTRAQVQVLCDAFPLYPLADGDGR